MPVLPLQPRFLSHLLLHRARVTGCGSRPRGAYIYRALAELHYQLSPSSSPCSSLISSSYLRAVPYSELPPKTQLKMCVLNPTATCRQLTPTASERTLYIAAWCFCYVVHIVRHLSCRIRERVLAMAPLQCVATCVKARAISEQILQ